MGGLLVIDAVGKRRLLQGEFCTHILYFVLVLLLFYFYLHRFIKNTKKLVSFIVVISLLLVHYVVS
jgi:predicted membrane protein